MGIYHLITLSSAHIQGMIAMLPCLLILSLSVIETFFYEIESRVSLLSVWCWQDLYLQHQEANWNAWRWRWAKQNKHILVLTSLKVYFLTSPFHSPLLSGISQIRLDFEATTDLGIEENGMPINNLYFSRWLSTFESLKTDHLLLFLSLGMCIDTLTTTNSMSASPNFFPPAICGRLSGEHSESSKC